MIYQIGEYENMVQTCPNIDYISIGSLYCTQHCDFCKNVAFSHGVYTISCNYMSSKRKEKLKYLNEKV